MGTGGWGLFGGTGGNGAYTVMLAMGMITAALTGAYMTRVVYLTFFGEFRGHGTPHESGPGSPCRCGSWAASQWWPGSINFPAASSSSPRHGRRSSSSGWNPWG